MPTVPPLTSNPNAEVAVYTGAGTIILVWLLSVFGIDVPAEIGAAITTVATGLVLFLGKRQRK